MFETPRRSVEAIIESHAAAWRAHSMKLVDAAYAEVDRILGLPASFTNRSRGQRLRHKRKSREVSA